MGVPAKPSGFPLYLCSLSPLLIVELSAPLLVPRSHFPFPNPVPAPKPRPQIPNPVPAWLAKDAAPIPNALAAAKKKSPCFQKLSLSFDFSLSSIIHKYFLLKHPC